MDTGLTGLRPIIIARAERLECTEEVRGLPDAEAVWFIQRREGMTPCFARRSPFCTLHRCLWHAHCCSKSPERSKQAELRASTIESIVSRHGDFSLPLLIAKQAFGACCFDDVKDLPEVGAVRSIQTAEGYTPCYACQQALHPSGQSTVLCGERFCIWKPYCDLYRSPEVEPMEKSFPSLSNDDLEKVRAVILDCVKEPSFVLPKKSVGLKLCSLNSLAASTRKMLLVTPNTTVAEAFGDSHANLHRYLVSRRTESSRKPYDNTIYIEHEWRILETSNIAELVRWLRAVKPFMEAGTIDYWPLFSTTTAQAEVDSKGGREKRGGPIPASWAGETFDAPHLATPEGDIYLTEPGLVPLFHIDLPVLEGIGFNTLYDLMRDHPEELTSFRDFFQCQMEEMRSSAIGSDTFVADCWKIERNIRDSVRKLQSDLKRAQMKLAFSLAQCAVASWTLAVYGMLRGDADVLKVIGPGGVAYAASSAYAEYLFKRMEVKECPVYFLWELGVSKKQ